MDFVLSEEQRMLSESLRRLVDDRFTFSARRARRGKPGVDQAAWQSLAEVGVLGLNISADYDGFGEDASTLLPVHQELGRGLVGEPVIASAVVSATLIAESGASKAASTLLPAIASGEAIVTVAYQEPGQRYAVKPVNVQAQAKGDGYVISGQKVHVWHGASATSWLVTAALEGGETGIFVIGSDVDGVTVEDAPTIDSSRTATLTFNDVQVPAEGLLVKGAQADLALSHALDWGIAALVAHAAGAMERLIEVTVDYLKTRKQFGQPLAVFQTLQHRLADMLIAKEMALSMAYVAVAALTEPDEKRRTKMIASAKMEAARAGRYVGQQAVQLHGGMGMTDELEVGDFFKRLTAIDMLWGDTREQLRKLGALL